MHPLKWLAWEVQERIAQKQHLVLGAGSVFPRRSSPAVVLPDSSNRGVQNEECLLPKNSVLLEGHA